MFDREDTSAYSAYGKGIVTQCNNLAYTGKEPTKIASCTMTDEQRMEWASLHRSTASCSRVLHKPTLAEVIALAKGL